MAKKKLPIPSAHEIVRTDQPWGSRLLLRPFPGDQQLMHLEIAAEIEKPSESRRLPQVKIRFSSVPIQTPFNMGHARVWLKAVQALVDATKPIYDTMLAKEKAPPKGGAKVKSRSR